MQRRLLEVLLFCAALGFLSYIAYAAYQAYEKNAAQVGPLETPLERILKAAHDNDPEAQFELGKIYTQGGYGLPANPQSAFEWYKKSADQGHQQAQITVGYFYQTGEIVAKDLHEAIRYYTAPAEAGEMYAIRNLAVVYDEATDIPDHKLKAAVMYLEAAEKGDAYAQYKTGRNYFEGNGLLQDDTKAFEWLSKAYNHEKKAYGASELGFLYLKGRGVEKNIAKAAALFKKEADQDGEAEAKYIIEHATFCQNIFQYKFSPDFLESCLFAAEAGHAESQFTLATIITNGSIGALPHRPAGEYLEMAARQGHLLAQIDLAQRYGNSVNAREADLEKAYGWLYAISCRKAATPDEGNSIRQAQSDLIGMEGKLSPALIQKARSDFNFLCIQ